MHYKKKENIELIWETFHVTCRNQTKSIGADYHHPHNACMFFTPQALFF